jgi:hypothetical protein
MSSKPPRGAFRVWSPQAILIVATVIGVLGFILAPVVQRTLGLALHGVWFADSHAILAATDAVRLGHDPAKPNPLDVFHRPHVYSDWWLVLARTSLTRDDNFLVGGLWVLAFLVVAWATLRPRDTWEAVWYTTLLLSPSVLLAIHRANNDLVVFTILGLGVMALRFTAAPGWIFMLLAVALATGLKFYPAVAAGVFILLRPGRRMIAALAVSAVVLTVVALDVLPSISRGMFPLPRTVYTFGAAIFFDEIGWRGWSGRVAAVAVIGMGALFLWHRKWTTGLGDESVSLRERALFATGAILLVACFIAGTSYSYRCIFALWLAPWLFEQARDRGLPAFRQTSAKVAIVLVFSLLWVDGFSVVVTNMLIAPESAETLARVLVAWRLVSQPLAWVLMLMLAGWLLDAVVGALRSVRRGPGVAATARDGAHRLVTPV